MQSKDLWFIHTKISNSKKISILTPLRIGKKNTFVAHMQQKSPCANIYFCLFWCRDMEKKPSILAELSHDYKIHEVDFDTMLSIIEACQDLTVQPVLPANDTPLDHKNRNNSTSIKQPNMWSLLKGILPGTKWYDFLKNSLDGFTNIKFSINEFFNEHLL